MGTLSDLKVLVEWSSKAWPWLLSLMSGRARFTAHVPRIREALDTYHATEPGAVQHFISLTCRLAVHLQALGIPCPAEPPTVNDVDPWLRFLERLLPLAELGRLREARDLRC